MKTKKFKPLISLLHLVSFCMVILGVGCSNKDTCSVEQLSGAIDDITGQWRQFKTEQINGGPPALVYDYSCDNIFYSFNEDNVLIVWSDQADYLGFEGENTHSLLQNLLMAKHITHFSLMMWNIFVPFQTIIS